ncbi:MAG TPA: hypothetical protein PLM89_07290 [Anaerolineales bacterium]|nr:hypothetical protein [Anaerolineales bacterium]
MTWKVQPSETVENHIFSQSAKRTTAQAPNFHSKRGLSAFTRTWVSASKAQSGQLLMRPIFTLSADEHVCADLGQRQQT